MDHRAAAAYGAAAQALHAAAQSHKRSAEMHRRQARKLMGHMNTVIAEARRQGIHIRITETPQTGESE